MSIKSNLMMMILSKYLSKKLKKKFSGMNINLNKVDVIDENGRIIAHLDLTIIMTEADLENVMKEL